MAIATGLPEAGFLRPVEWERQAERKPDMSRFADPTFELSAEALAGHPGAPGGSRTLPDRRVFYISRLRKRAERTIANLCV